MTWSNEAHPITYNNSKTFSKIKLLKFSQKDNWPEKLQEESLLPLNSLEFSIRITERGVKIAALIVGNMNNTCTLLELLESRWGRILKSVQLNALVEETWNCCMLHDACRQNFRLNMEIRDIKLRKFKQNFLETWKIWKKPYFPIISEDWTRWKFLEIIITNPWYE